MRYVLLLMTAVLALAGIVIGLAHIVGGLVGYAAFAGAGDLGNIVESSGYPYHDNASRFLGGVFFSAGLGFAYCLHALDAKMQLFRFLLLGMFIGGLARVVGWFDLGLTESTIAATTIELLFPPVMLLLVHRVYPADAA